MRGAFSPRAEDGAVMVMVAIALPVLILFASFAIDVGNWFVHDRHLQTQADAGALAAAGDFQYPCENTKIESRAKEYAGVEATGYNHQIGTGSGGVDFALNSSTYPDQPSKTDPTVVAEPPCEAGMIDVKVTEKDIPLFLRVAGLFGSVPFINAHARVQIFSDAFVSGALPVAVPDNNPHSASVTFIDEETHSDLFTAPLVEGGTSGELAIWQTAEPVSLPVESEQIGMRVNLGGGKSSTCGQPLVECYDAGSSNGLLYVRGFSMAGSGAQPSAPLPRSVRLFGGSLEEGACVDPYFSAGGCAVGVHADVDFGPCEKIGAVGAKLKAVVAGASYEMTPVGCAEGSSISEWETKGAEVPIAAEAGPVPVTIEWAETKGKEGGSECKEGGGNKCKGSFGTVQRSFAASEERSGPIELAQLSEGGEPDANSLERCSSCTHEVTATIGVEENLAQNAASVESPLVTLRAEDPNQNQALDCDPTLNLREEIAQGCAPKYAINQGTFCPSPAELEKTAEPWECVVAEVGATEGQLWQGMNERILGEAKSTTCSAPNHWSLFPGGNNFAADPRVVPVLLTPFGSFSSSGKEAVPVTGFATFYVTGWAGTAKTSQEVCSGDDLAPKRTIVGHFIKYVEALNEGQASEEACDFSSPTPCVAVLTE